MLNDFKYLISLLVEKYKCFIVRKFTKSSIIPMERTGKLLLGLMPYTLNIPYQGKHTEDICIDEKDIISKSFIYYGDTTKKVFMQVTTFATIEMLRHINMKEMYPFFYATPIEKIKDIGLLPLSNPISLMEDTLNYLPCTRIKAKDDNGDFIAMGFMAPKNSMDNTLTDMKRTHTVHSMWMKYDKEDFTMENKESMTAYDDCFEIVIIHKKENKLSEKDLNEINNNVVCYIKNSLPKISKYLKSEKLSEEKEITHSVH